MAIVRIVSLVPAGTEIAFALGLGRDVVAVSHECDYPAQARDLPRLTQSAIGGATLTNGQIDAAVSARKATGAPLYHIDADQLTGLAPDLILTQGLCNVCALPSRAMRAALAQMSPRPAIVSLDGPGSRAIARRIQRFSSFAFVPPLAAVCRSLLHSKGKKRATFCEDAGRTPIRWQRGRSFERRPATLASQESAEGWIPGVPS